MSISTHTSIKHPPIRQFMYYHKLVVVFSKTASSTPYFLHVENTMVGSDLGVYPANFYKYYLIAYGILSEAMDLDPNKTYNYHTAYDIQPTKVVYNVDLDMNGKRILNIAPDQNRSNSAATVKMVKDLYPFTKNNVYRTFFEEFCDFSDASNYKLTMGASGITFTGINSNITFPQMNIADRCSGRKIEIKKSNIEINII